MTLVLRKAMSDDNGLVNVNGAGEGGGEEILRARSLAMASRRLSSSL